MLRSYWMLTGHKAIMLAAVDNEPNKQITESVINEATSFYKLVVTTATVFLGGTLIFWEKIAPAISQASVIALGCGWLCLIVSIALIVFARRDNIELGRLVLKGRPESNRQDKIAKRCRCFTTASGVFLSLGMLFTASAGFIALWNKAETMQESTNTSSSSGTKSIPYVEIAGSGNSTTSSDKETPKETPKKD